MTTSKLPRLLSRITASAILASLLAASVGAKEPEGRLPRAALVDPISFRIEGSGKASGLVSITHAVLARSSTSEQQRTGARLWLTYRVAGQATSAWMPVEHLASVEWTDGINQNNVMVQTVEGDRAAVDPTHRLGWWLAACPATVADPQSDWTSCTPISLLGNSKNAMETEEYFQADFAGPLHRSPRPARWTNLAQVLYAASDEQRLIPLTNSFRIVFSDKAERNANLEADKAKRAASRHLPVLWGEFRQGLSPQQLLAQCANCRSVPESDRDRLTSAVELVRIARHEAYGVTGTVSFYFEEQGGLTFVSETFHSGSPEAKRTFANMVAHFRARHGNPKSETAGDDPRMGMKHAQWALGSREVNLLLLIGEKSGGKASVLYGTR